MQTVEKRNKVLMCSNRFVNILPTNTHGNIHILHPFLLTFRWQVQHQLAMRAHWTQKKKQEALSGHPCYFLSNPPWTVTDQPSRHQHCIFKFSNAQSQDAEMLDVTLLVKPIRTVVNSPHCVIFCLKTVVLSFLFAQVARCLPVLPTPEMTFDLKRVGV